MPLKRMLAGVGAALLFAIGLAAAALADSPTTTTTTTTTDTTSTATTTPITTTTSTSTSTSTATVPPPTTSTRTTTETTTTSTTRTTASPPSARPVAPAPGLRRSGSAHAKTPATGKPGRHKKRRKHRRKSHPLKVTPPLGQSHFIFPIVGPAVYGDSYGGPRSDVRGGWHHGDDIFAPLGTPVVAVASGTINRVGWERVGGWRLWVRDSAADEFYYAHLSGYTRSVFHSRQVRAGQVIGFVGNTGDAFGGAAHLHFEIHPRQLLSLRYDGAVDPTTYLDGWTHLRSVRAPRPMHPRLPEQPQLRSEARLVFRRLLVARHLAKPKMTVALPQHVAALGADIPLPTQPLPLRHAAVAAPPLRNSASLTLPLLGGLSGLAALGAAAFLARLWRGRRRSAAEAAPEEPAA